VSSGDGLRPKGRSAIPKENEGTQGVHRRKVAVTSNMNVTAWD